MSLKLLTFPYFLCRTFELSIFIKYFYILSLFIVYINIHYIYLFYKISNIIISHSYNVMYKIHRKVRYIKLNSSIINNKNNKIKINIKINIKIKIKIKKPLEVQ